LRAKATVTLSFNGKIKLMYQRKSGKTQVHLLGFIKRDAHILDEVLDKKSPDRSRAGEYGVRDCSAPNKLLRRH
jgi:hypothetical protein